MSHGTTAPPSVSRGPSTCVKMGVMTASGGQVLKDDGSAAVPGVVLSGGVNVSVAPPVVIVVGAVTLGRVTVEPEMMAKPDDTTTPSEPDGLVLSEVELEPGSGEDAGEEGATPEEEGSVSEPVE